MGCTPSRGIPSEGTHPNTSQAVKPPNSSVAGSYRSSSDSGTSSMTGASGAALSKAPPSKASPTSNHHNNNNTSSSSSSSNNNNNNNSSSSNSSISNANGKRNALYVGQNLLSRDKFQSKFTGEWMYKWRKASVVAIEDKGRRILIHYEGWSDAHDVWVDLTTDLSSIAPLTMLSKEDCDKGTPLTVAQCRQVHAFVGADHWDSASLEGATTPPQLSSPPPPPYEWTDSSPRKPKVSSKSKAGIYPDLNESSLCPPGTMLDVLDIFYKNGSDQPSRKWRKARVIESNGTCIRVNFIGWDSKFDENLDLFRDSHRISEFGTKSTEQTSKSVAMSRSPGSIRKSVTGSYLSPSRLAASSSDTPLTPSAPATPSTVAMTATPATPFEPALPSIHTSMVGSFSPAYSERSSTAEYQDGYLSAAAPYGLQAGTKSSPRGGKPNKTLREETAALASSAVSDPVVASTAKPALRRVASKESHALVSPSPASHAASTAPAAASTGIEYVSDLPDASRVLPSLTSSSATADADAGEVAAMQPNGSSSSEATKAGKTVSIEGMRLIPDSQAAPREISRPSSEEAKSSIFGGLFKPFKAVGSQKPAVGESSASPPTPSSSTANGQAPIIIPQTTVAVTASSSASSTTSTAASPVQATAAEGSNGQAYYSNSITSSRAIFKRIMQFVNNSKSSSESGSTSVNGHGNGLHGGSSRSKKEQPKSEEDQQVEELMAQTAEEMKEEIERERKFIESLGAKGLHVIEVEGDGNCLFRAVSHQLFLNEDHHEELRNWCVDHLINHKERFQVFCPDNFDSYIESMRQLGTWGDDLEIRALEEIIDRNIRIYSSDAPDPTVPINNNFEEETLLKGLTPLSLSYHGQNHYNSIYDEQTPLPLPTRTSRTLLTARMKLLDQRPTIAASGYGGSLYPPRHQLHPYVTPHGQAIPPMPYTTRSLPPPSPAASPSSVSSSSSSSSSAVPHHPSHMHPHMHGAAAHSSAPASASLLGGHAQPNLLPHYAYPRSSPYGVHNYHNPSMHPPPQAYLPPPRGGHMPASYRPAPQPVSNRQPRYY